MNIILSEVKNNKVIIEVFGTIGSSFFEEGFTVNSLRTQLEGLEFDDAEIEDDDFIASIYTDNGTTSIFISPQGNSLGSRTAVTVTVLPSITIASSLPSTVPW